MNKVLLFSQFKEQKDLVRQESDYRQRLDSMDLPSLLEEIVKYQTEKSKNGETRLVLRKGQILYETVQHSATTIELKLLAKTYLKYLNFELKRLEGN